MHRLLCVSALALALASAALADDKPTKPDQHAIPGGYSPIKIDSEMRKAAAFAVKAQAEATGKPLRLVDIVKAERQVVAGLNFRLEIEVADGSKHLNAHVVVWKKLDGSLALTSWD